ncbi:hypothetical protein tloyanaT_26330 [Thalassotalea loyana]|uniref:DUF6950 domain-containing protein n=1 Tax=Thalassotalea loyana TaxID=280483 RepID=A0ABQ6HHU9_9GAMM|nr:hypothetical protein [Thalassotalea loyana]GLX86380.1 hypothetical protein tloyanaT_26330 [Thalassotalea loyana]
MKAVDQVIKQKLHKPFKWGENDCCLIAADLVSAMTGQDPAAAFRGTYDSEVGALKIIAKHGGSVETLLDSYLSEPKPINQAKTGDIALLLNERGQQQACIVFRSVVYAPGENGLVRKPLSQALKIWSIKSCHQ